MTFCIRRLLVLIVLLLSIGTCASQDSPGPSQGTVEIPVGKICQLAAIKGLELSAARGYGVLPNPTKTFDGMAIYVEKTSQGFYFQSNYISGDASFPTKVLFYSDNDLQRAFLTIINPSQQHTYSFAARYALRALRQNVHIYLDKSLFDEGGYPEVNLGDAHLISIVDSDTGKISDPVDRLDRVSAPPILIANVLGCCLYGIPPHLARQYATALAARPFDRSNVRFLTLVKDTGTGLAIDAAENVKAARIGDSEASVVDLAQVDSAFKAASGRTVVLLSHVEGENFVTRDAAQNVVSSIPIVAVRELATKYNVELIDLGCETAQQSKMEQLGVGVISKFNSVEAVQAIDQALSHAASYADFFRSLTSQNLRIVIDHGIAMPGWPLCADVYSQPDRGTVWIKLARIFVWFRQK